MNIQELLWELQVSHHLRRQKPPKAYYCEKQSACLPGREVWEVLIIQTWTWLDIKFQLVLEHSAPPLSAGEPLQFQHCSSPARFNFFMMYQENCLGQLEL